MRIEEIFLNSIKKNGELDNYILEMAVWIRHNLQQPHLEDIFTEKMVSYHISYRCMKYQPLCNAHLCAVCLHYIVFVGCTTLLCVLMYQHIFDWICKKGSSTHIQYANFDNS